MMTITGRSYARTRPRGFAPWTPQASSRALLDEALTQLDLWEAQQPVTARQLFYGLVGRGTLPKTESAYSRLCEVLNRGRRAGLVPWSTIRDDGATFAPPRGYTGPDDFVAAVGRSAESYRRHRQGGQAIYVEIWCEAAGMAPQLRRVADPFGVPVVASGGFESTTAKHAAASRFADRKVPTIVLHVGDHDPSGCAIIDSAASDIEAFAPGAVEFRRLAVTPAQIAAMALPTAPQKPGDRRGERMAATVQAEAINPARLALIVVAAIEAELDLEIREELLAVEASERAELAARVEGLFR